jgi:hypothetical protein
MGDDEAGPAEISEDGPLDVPSLEARVPPEWQSKMSTRALSNVSPIEAPELARSCSQIIEAKVKAHADGEAPTTLAGFAWPWLEAQHGSFKLAEAAAASMVSGVESSWQLQPCVRLFGELCGMLTEEYSQPVERRVLRLLRDGEEGSGGAALVPLSAVASTLLGEGDAGTVAMDQVVAALPRLQLPAERLQALEAELQALASGDGVRLDAILLAALTACRAAAEDEPEEMPEEMSAEQQEAAAQAAAEATTAAAPAAPAEVVSTDAEEEAEEEADEEAEEVEASSSRGGGAEGEGEEEGGGSHEHPELGQGLEPVPETTERSNFSATQLGDSAGRKAGGFGSVQAGFFDASKLDLGDDLDGSSFMTERVERPPPADFESALAEIELLKSELQQASGAQDAMRKLNARRAAGLLEANDALQAHLRELNAQVERVLQREIKRHRPGVALPAATKSAPAKGPSAPTKPGKPRAPRMAAQGKGGPPAGFFDTQPRPPAPSPGPPAAADARVAELAQLQDQDAEAAKAAETPEPPDVEEATAAEDEEGGEEEDGEEAEPQ